MHEELAAFALLACCAGAVRSPAQAEVRGSPAQPAQRPVQSEAPVILRYTVELEGLREAAQRLELRAPGWRLLALVRSAGLDLGYLAFGLSCPWGAAGPLAPRGLLRALADPLGYSPGSGVFSEPAGFRVESALQGAARRGLWLEPLPGRLGLFVVRRPSDPAGLSAEGLLDGEPLGLLQAGGAVTLRWPASVAADVAAGTEGCVEVQALAMLSRPEADEPVSPDPSSGTGTPDSSSEWCHERPPFPGGSLLHLGTSLRMDAGGGRLACSILGAASGGQRVPPGLAALWRLEARGEAWNVSGLLGACTEEYRLPQGELYPGAWEAGLGLELRPRPALRLAGSWQRRVDRPPAAPEGCLPGTEQGELSVRLSTPLRAGGRLEARADAKARVTYAADGGVEGSAAGELGLLLRGNPGRLEVELRADWKGEGIGLRGQLCGERRGVRLQAGTAVRPAASGACWRPFGRLELAGKDFFFWCSAGGGDAGREVSLGWSAAQPLAKSPTVRTSRCRR